MTANQGINLVDAHCHLNFNEFDPDRAQVVKRAFEHGITRMLIPGVDIETSQSAIKCSQEFPKVFAAVGVHPNSGKTWTQDTISVLKHLAGNEKVVAIGEIGLDYYRDLTPKEIQKAIFIQQLELSSELELPVIIHNRDAEEDIAEILGNWYRELLSHKSVIADHPGELHSFSGSLDFAKEMTAQKFKLGITGPVTFHNSQALQLIVKSLPLESLLVETDAPYLTPHPYRGKRNEPANVRIVAEKVAELKAAPLDLVAQRTTEVAEKLFNWREILD